MPLAEQSPTVGIIPRQFLSHEGSTWRRRDVHPVDFVSDGGPDSGSDGVSDSVSDSGSAHLDLFLVNEQAHALGVYRNVVSVEVSYTCTSFH